MLIGIILSVTMISWMKEDNSKPIIEANNSEGEVEGTKNDDILINLSLSTFGQIYKLTEDVEFNQIYLSSYDRKRKLDMETITLNKEKFKDVYEALLKLHCVKSSKNEIATTKNPYDYSIDFNIKENHKYRSFNVGFGKSYLLVSLVGVNDYLYKHELLEEDYLKIKELLDRVKSNNSY